MLRKTEGVTLASCNIYTIEHETVGSPWNVRVKFSHLHVTSATFGQQCAL